MILLAGVGYSHLSDLSFGPLLAERMEALAQPGAIQVEDLSYGPIGVLMWLEEVPARFTRAIFAGAVERGRPPGTLQMYRWEPGTHDAETVQARIAEAVTGVIALDNLLIILDHFGVLPSRTSVIELEPVDKEFGTEMSAAGRRRLEEAMRWVEGEIETYHALVENGRTATP